MDALKSLAAVYANPLHAAEAWKASGGKVVGYLCDNVPDELIAAAGFFPLRVKGAPETDIGIVDDSVDRLYTPDVTVRAPSNHELLQVRPDKPADQRIALQDIDGSHDVFNARSGVCDVMLQQMVDDAIEVVSDLRRQFEARHG